MNDQVALSLRRRLTLLARGRRISTIKDNLANTMPQSVRTDMVRFEGKMVKRLRVVLLTPRCQSATCTMCPLPNEAVDVRYRTISSTDIVAQVNAALDGLSEDVELITLYNNGNFFADSEVSPFARNLIYHAVASSGARVLLVESLPQFITEEKLDIAKSILGTKKLVVAIGLQSSDDTVRELAVNTTCTRKSFEKSLNILRKRGYGIQAFLMVKPPFVTEDEASCDVARSVKYLADLGIYDPILCATRVAPNTVLELMAQNGHFRPPWIWSVVESLVISKFVSPKSHPRVVTSELVSEYNPDSHCASNCAECSSRLIDVIGSYNETGDIDQILDISCKCEVAYRDAAIEEQKKYGCKSIEDRIKDFLNTVGF